MTMYRIPVAELAQLRELLARLATESAGDDGEHALVIADVLVPALARPPRPGAGHALACPHCGRAVDVTLAAHP